MRLAMFIIVVFLLSVLAAGSEAWHSAPKEYNDMTNVNIWQCNNSTGQKWYKSTLPSMFTSSTSYYPM